jgi:hypothetical protein
MPSSAQRSTHGSQPRCPAGTRTDLTCRSVATRRSRAPSSRRAVAGSSRFRASVAPPPLLKGLHECRTSFWPPNPGRRALRPLLAPQTRTQPASPLAVDRTRTASSPIRSSEWPPCSKGVGPAHDARRARPTSLNKLRADETAAIRAAESKLLLRGPSARNCSAAFKTKERVVGSRAWAVARSTCAAASAKHRWRRARESGRLDLRGRHGDLLVRGRGRARCGHRPM